jgi:hypothetical protein
MRRHRRHAVVSQRGMAVALGLRGVENPLIFLGGSGGREQPPVTIHDHDYCVVVFRNAVTERPMN